MNKSNERSLLLKKGKRSPSLKEEKRSILTKLLRKLRNSPTPTAPEDLKKFEKEKKRLEKKLKEHELKIEELVLGKTLDELDPDFDKKLECCLKTPPLKLKDLKEQLKREREGTKSHSETGEKQGSH